MTTGTPISQKICISGAWKHKAMPQTMESMCRPLRHSNVIFFFNLGNNMGQVMNGVMQSAIKPDLPVCVSHNSLMSSFRNPHLSKWKKACTKASTAAIDPARVWT